MIEKGEAAYAVDEHLVPCRDAEQLVAQAPAVRRHRLGTSHRQMRGSGTGPYTGQSARVRLSSV